MSPFTVSAGMMRWCGDVPLELRIKGDRISGCFHPKEYSFISIGEITYLLTIDPNFFGHPRTGFQKSFFFGTLLGLVKKKQEATTKFGKWINLNILKPIIQGGPKNQL